EADRLVATTAAEARILLAMGSSPERTSVVPCGVDLSRFRPGGPALPRRRGRARIVVASRLVPRKGVGDLIDALPSVPGAELVVAGGSPAGLVLDDGEGARLHLRAEELGVADRVSFLGAVPRDRMPAVLRSADVVACCPWYEPFGLVAVEAMACGVPVVATAVGGLAETVVDGVTGLHVAPRDPEAIALALRRLLGDPCLRRRMADAAARRAQRYGWDDVAAETLQLAEATVAAGVGSREVGR
ncbi:MAG TPA: glycosyltransferase, partial [Aquihabitans sp.]|nr:glycosyltransferase [Aquihabitans sp.]